MLFDLSVSCGVCAFHRCSASFAMTVGARATSEATPCVPSVSFRNKGASARRDEGNAARSLPAISVGMRVFLFLHLQERRQGQPQLQCSASIASRCQAKLGPVSGARGLHESIQILLRCVLYMPGQCWLQFAVYPSLRVQCLGSALELALRNTLFLIPALVRFMGVCTLGASLVSRNTSCARLAL